MTSDPLPDDLTTADTVFYHYVTPNMIILIFPTTLHTNGHFASHPSPLEQLKLAQVMDGTKLTTDPVWDAFVI